MMFSVVAAFIVPLFLALTLATGWYRPLSSVTGRWSDAAVFTSTLLVILFLWFVVPWSFVSLYARWLVAALAVAGAVRFAIGLRSRPVGPGTIMQRISQGATVAIGLAAAFGVVVLAGARTAPEDTIALRFPLEGGRFVVGQGGGNVLLNYHHSYPPQRYALDIVALDRWGRRAGGLFPNDREQYAVMGASVVAPCSGRVAAARDALPDADGPQRETEAPAGNMVAIECKGAVVILAHLEEGSVRVETGDRVEAGAPIGRVGNSGNTTEPHLHIHAERGRYMGEGSDQEGVAITFDGQFLTRNDVVAKPLSGPSDLRQDKL